MNEVSVQLPSVITKDVIGRFEFAPYVKKGTTQISTFTVPPGYSYDTSEGLKAEDEETRIAIDTQGNVYPIRESVFQESYEEAGR